MPLGGGELIGALPDAIAWALVQVVKAVSMATIGLLMDIGYYPLLTVANPIESPEAQAAWLDFRNIAIMLLPLALAGGLIVWPFSEDRQISPWEMVLRMVGILLFITISKPLWGFAIDASNAVTMALAPESFTISFHQDAFGTLGALADLFIIPTVALAMLISFLVTALLLVLRWFLIWVAFLGTPLFAVMVYPNWGPLTSINKYGATFLRMGVYGVIAGPVIALVFRVAAVIMGGGMIQRNNDIAGTILQLGVTVALVAIIPVALFVVIYKVIAWAGQPIGIGQVFTTAVAAVAATIGAAAGGIAGGVAGGATGGGAGGSAGGAGSGAGGGGAASGGAGGGRAAATDPSAGTGESMLNAGVDNSIDEETWAAADEAVENGIDTGPAHSVAGKGAAVAKGMKSLPKKAAKKGAGAAGSGRGLPGEKLAEKLQEHREKAAEHKAKAAEAEENMEMLNIGAFKDDEGRVITGDDRDEAEAEFDVAKAKEQGLFEAHEAVSEAYDGPIPTPADGAEAKIPNKGRKMEITTPSGNEEPVSIETLRNKEEAKFSHHMSNARAHAKTAERLKTAAAGGKAAGSATGKVLNAQKRLMKVGGAAMVGAVSGNPYYGYRIGKEMGGKSYVGGAKNWLIGPDQTTADASTGVQSTFTDYSHLGGEARTKSESADKDFSTYF